MGKVTTPPPKIVEIHEEGVFSDSIRNTINSNFVIVDKSRPLPAPEGFSSSSRGEQGQVYYDATGIYICIEKDVWRLVPLVEF